MSYEKQTWADGQTITASKLNHMEDGIFEATEDSGSLPTPYIVHMEVNLGAGTATVTDGKTIADILAVADSNPFVFAEFPLGLNSTGRLPLMNWDATEGDTSVYFSGVSAGAKGVAIDGKNEGTGDTFTIVTES